MIKRGYLSVYHLSNYRWNENIQHYYLRFSITKYHSKLNELIVVDS